MMEDVISRYIRKHHRAIFVAQKGAKRLLVLSKPIIEVHNIFCFSLNEVPSTGPKTENITSKTDELRSSDTSNLIIYDPEIYTN